MRRRRGATAGRDGDMRRRARRDGGRDGDMRRRDATADAAVRRRRPRCDGGRGATAGDPSRDDDDDEHVRLIDAATTRRWDATAATTGCEGTAAGGRTRGGWIGAGRRRADGRAAAVAAGRAATGRLDVRWRRAAGCATEAAG